MNIEYLILDQLDIKSDLGTNIYTISLRSISIKLNMFLQHTKFTEWTPRYQTHGTSIFVRESIEAYFRFVQGFRVLFFSYSSTAQAVALPRLINELILTQMPILILLYPDSELRLKRLIKQLMIFVPPSQWKTIEHFLRVFILFNFLINNLQS